MKFNGIIFDLDGTLIDSLQDIADSMNRVLARFGFPRHGNKKYRYYIGEGLENLVRRSLPRGHKEWATIQNCMTHMRDEYRKRFADSTKPYEGIPELLSFLASKETPMAVLSNKPQDLASLLIEKLLPRCSFHMVLGEKQGLQRKPHPGGALKIAVSLGIPAQEFLYLGDTCTDMKTAEAAGMFPAGALWGYREKEELVSCGAKRLMEKSWDVKEFLGKD